MKEGNLVEILPELMLRPPECSTYLPRKSIFQLISDLDFWLAHCCPAQHQQDQGGSCQVFGKIFWEQSFITLTIPQRRYKGVEVSKRVLLFQSRKGRMPTAWVRRQNLIYKCCGGCNMVDWNHTYHLKSGIPSVINFPCMEKKVGIRGYISGQYK